jgi:ActR/RegA family two-component response regulator
MNPLTCASAQRMLQAFHDRELAISDQIAVGAHIEWCDRCAATLAEFRAIGSALSALAPGRTTLSNEEAAVFNATVVNRLKAEQDASLVARIRDMFADIRLVYAGGGAAVATIVFVVIMLGMMRFATNERPDSLAAIVTLVATPLECEPGSEGADAAVCRARWEARFQRANESAEQESVFALDSAVTHQSGHLANLEVLRAGRHNAVGQAKAIEALLDAVTRLRLEGALPIGAPVPGSILWLVEHATVRASAVKPPPLEAVAPALKKRADTFSFASRSVRA